MDGRQKKWISLVIQYLSSSNYVKIRVLLSQLLNLRPIKYSEDLLNKNGRD
jgi:hypothetical protein